LPVGEPAGREHRQPRLGTDHAQRWTAGDPSPAVHFIKGPNSGFVSPPAHMCLDTFRPRITVVPPSVLAGVGLSGTLAHLGLQSVAAQCGLVRTSTQRASRCSRRNPCCENARCKNKRCKCKPEWCDTDDDGLCETQLGTDAACKACDDACDEFQSCRGVFGTRFKDCCRPLGQVCELGQCCFERRSAPWGAGSHASEAATTAGMCGSTCSAQRAPGEGRLRRRD
jgi:hypothetical protein